MSLYLVQLQHRQQGARCASRVDDGLCRPSRDFTSTYYDTVQAVPAHRQSLTSDIRDDTLTDPINYDRVHWYL